MNWETQGTIHKIQESIKQMDMDGIRPTRAALADSCELSLSYVHRLVQKNPDYLGTPGDGTVSIVKVMDAPRYRPIRQEGNNNKDKGNHDTPLSVLQSSEFLSLMTRLVEATEQKPVIEQTGGEITKNTAARQYGDLIPDKLRIAMFKHINWDSWDRIRNELPTIAGRAGQGNPILMNYLLYCNLEKHLKANKEALTLECESLLEWAKTQAENQQSE